MSAFLGPIHHWMYRKIQFQNEMVDRLIAFAAQRNDDIAAPLARQYGTPETAPLEDVIDPSNIHGWLQQRVSQAERRMAGAVKLMLDHHTATEDELGGLLRTIGTQMRPGAIPSAAAAYQLLGDLLLDGMPCDGANVLVSESDTQVVWRKNICVHTPYWNEVGLDVELHDTLREHFIAGLLDGTGLAVMRQGAEYIVRSVT